MSWPSIPTDILTSWGTIGEGPRKKLSYMSFGAFEDDIDNSQSACRRWASDGSIRRRASTRTDFGSTTMTATWSRSRSPRNLPRTKRAGLAIRASGPGKRGAPFRSTMGRTYPRRLAHILMFTRDVRKAIEFYTRVLGLRLSDHSGDNIAFLHGIHGSDHHLIAFARSDAPGHSPFQLGRRNGRRDRRRRHAHARQGLRQGLGARAARARLKFLPLCAGSLGQLLRIFRGHRLCAGRLRLAGWGSSAGGSRSTPGGRQSPTISCTTTRLERRSRASAARVEWRGAWGKPRAAATRIHAIGSTCEYLTCASAKLDLIDAIPSTLVNFSLRNRSYADKSATTIRSR